MTNTITVGSEYSGDLTVSNGGQVSCASLRLGEEATGYGTVEVSGDGAALSARGEMIVGYKGDGHLSIIDGAEVHAGDTTIEITRWPGSCGTVLVRGEGSLLTTDAGAVRVGGYGTGTLTIQDGAQVEAQILIASFYGSTGTINLEGGALRASSLSIGDGTGTLNWTGGTLAITEAGELTLNSALLGSTAFALSGDHVLEVTNTAGVASGQRIVINGGAIVVGSLNVRGTLQVRSGTLDIDDVLTVQSGGSLQLAGQDIALKSAPTISGELTLDQTNLSVPSLALASGVTGRVRQRHARQ